MYKKLPNLILGFHGCNREVYNKVINEGEPLKASLNSYDWLGNGIYFWEQNYQRAFEWAFNRYGKDAAVIGAAIDLGNCLNLTDSAGASVLREGYELLKFRCEASSVELPKNRKSAKTKDVLLRDLDCAVIQQIHDYNTINNLPKFDSVRGIFTEGDPVYEGSEFLEKTHVQICICNPNCIKGYFTPISRNDEFDLP
ncbi:MAG: hypothetical protein J6A49_07020 [Clostridia bacterium]|nr:hypothetical protein [Clostridia bacterium]MBO5463046.1 hypothetical protein [Clostridia bacterium]